MLTVTNRRLHSKSLLLKKFNALERYSTSRVLKLTRPD